MANPTKFTWAVPTANTDGSAIAAGEITGYQVGVRPASGTPGVYTILAPVDSATATSDPIADISPALAYGSWVGAVQALTVNGPSAWSAEASFTLVAPPPPIPNPPTNFTVA
jgi:hypothetical protein